MAWSLSHTDCDMSKGNAQCRKLVKRPLTWTIIGCWSLDNDLALSKYSTVLWSETVPLETDNDEDLALF
jgi:hypothetical protein